MEFQEYPKALYRNGDYLPVADRVEEDVAAADGWTDWHADQAAMNGGATAKGETATPTRDEMKAKATELGLPFASNISTAKLAELLADAAKA